MHSAQTARSCKWPTGQRRAISRDSLGLFRDWQRTQTQSSVKVERLETANGCPVLRKAGTTAERHKCELRIPGMIVLARSSEARLGRVAFPLDKRLTWTSATRREVSRRALIPVIGRYSVRHRPFLRVVRNPLGNVVLPMDCDNPRASATIGWHAWKWQDECCD